MRQRRQVGLQDGGLVVVEALEGELRVRPVEAVIDDLQQWAGCYNDAPTRSAVDMLIEQRRREAASEEA